MTYFLIFLAVMVAALAALYLVGLNKPQTGADVYNDLLAGPVANLPPVLLPGVPAPADVDKLRFSLGLRGYRMDQVDEVLDRLRDALAAKDLRIAELESIAGLPAVGKASADETADKTDVDRVFAEPEADDAGDAPGAVPATTADAELGNGPTAAHPSGVA